MASEPVAYGRTPIETGWVFKEADTEHPFRTVSQFPTVNHLDLMHHGLIPDPARNKNARDVQWVGEREWIYKTTFDFAGTCNGEGSSHGNNSVHHVLVLEGLDTHCRISLNGQLLLRSDNMFLEWRIDVTDKLRAGANDLELYFESTFLVGKQLEKDQGFKNLYWNGDSSRMNVRKVPCHYGWDWGPTLLTAGPWRPIYLETFVTRISDLGIDIEVLDTLYKAIITVSVELEGAHVDTASTSLEISDPSGRKIDHGEIQGCGSYRFIIQNPSLWYPLGYGKQPLYTFTATVGDDLHKVSKRVGLRMLELVQRPLPGQKSLTFFFRVNNIPIYSQGTNWIPPDVFLPRMTLQRYRDWLTWAARGNQNMIRVWGGGIYEDDRFYDTCDELGVLVWQDFMMGCGAYPYHDYLVQSIKAEVEYNVRRLRHHACIALWCGNNEDYMFAELHNLKYDPTDDNPEHWIKGNFPGRYYYEIVFKQAVETLAPRVPYHLSSPYGGSYSNDPTVGDIHSWRVWMADQPRYPYQDYEKLTGRFVSEFGMKSFPCLRTINELIDNLAERHPQSGTMDMWHMAPEDQRTISMYLVDNLRHDNGIEAYSWATQVIQAESTDYSSRAFRRLWRGPGKEECAGCLIWQLNDCYPAVSWSLLDSAMRPKLAYYVSRRNYVPLLVGATRRVTEKKANEFTHVNIERIVHVELWASNLTLELVDADLEIGFVTLSGGSCVHSETRSVVLLPNRSTELGNVDFPEPYRDSSTASSLVVHLRLRERGGSRRVLARHTEFPQPLRHYDFSNAKVFIRPLKDGLSWTVGVTGGVVKAVELSVAADDDDLVDACLFSDNYLDLVPGDDQVITIDIKSPTKIPKGSVSLAEKHYG
ncbi:glycoside hydrolase family 2 protein [Rostrohypoxylon terebratum]|nr:glycoside hydrolase family 2 protein [Rostrohypoxylon terebratum]